MEIYITDKTGKRFWNTNVTDEWSQGERKNLNRHLAAILAGNKAYAKVGIDRATARIVDDSVDVEIDTMSDDDLLAELMA